jgi:RecA-family ATPase
MSNYKIQNWMYRQLIGTNKKHLEIIKGKYGEEVEIKDETVKKIKEWHRDTFYLFDINEYEILKDVNNFFDVLSVSATRHGVKLFIIDNLMSVLEENADSLFSDQANFVQHCKNFAIKYNVHVVLLAHPNKEKREVYGSEGNLSKRDISGSKNISNKADNIISIERNWYDGDDKNCDLIFTSQKDRESGQRKIILYNFSAKTLRFYNENTKENVIYGWDKEAIEEQQIQDAKYVQEKLGW